MNTETLLPLADCCLRLGIDTSFIVELEEHGLISTVTIEQTVFIDVIELPRLERIARMYDELEINLPGIEAIAHLLERVESMQDEITGLQNRLRLYE